MKKVYLLLVGGMVATYPANAQMHQKNDTLSVYRTHVLDPVVVTASGHHQHLKSSSTPVHVLTKSEIHEQGITTLDAALTHMLPQVSLAPNAMGSQLRLNGLGNKYILVLVNGQKLSGDISNNVDLNRVDMSRVKRIEVLDGAASSLYGSDAIGGVINIITDQPTNNLVSVTSDTRVSGHGQLTQSVNLDAYYKGFGSYTTFTHDKADSYRINPLEYVKGEDGETQQSLSPIFVGYKSNLFSQKFVYDVNRHLSFNASLSTSYKMTNRPDTRTDIAGGYDYEMRYKGLRWDLGSIYKINDKNSIQFTFTTDKFRYGKEYDVATKSNAIGDYIQQKKQRSYESDLKGVFHFVKNGTTVIGANWRNDFLRATSGNIDEHVYTLAGYVQHEQTIVSGLKATAGLRYNYHETFGNRLTPKFALMYSVGNFNLRANYAMGFRAPGLDELYYNYFSVNHGKVMVTFGDKNLKPEKSDYVALNAEYRTNRFSMSVNGFLNYINDMVIKDYVDVTPEKLAELRIAFPEMTDAQAKKLTHYSLYQNSDRGLVKGVQVNLWANVLPGFDLTANYAYTYAKTKTAEVWQMLERSIRNTATVAANYHHVWNKYALNINLNGRLQSKTYYPSYEDAPGFAVWNLNTTHTFDYLKWAFIEPSIGVDNILNKTDNRIDSDKRRYALYSPGRMLVVGLKVRFK